PRARSALAPTARHARLRPPPYAARPRETAGAPAPSTAGRWSARAGRARRCSSSRSSSSAPAPTRRYTPRRSSRTSAPPSPRPHVAPAPHVGPGRVAGFQFARQAPVIPGAYRLYRRPLAEGATWMEDFGVFWLGTVLNPDGPPPARPPVTGLGYSLKTVNTPVGQFQAHVVKERLADVTVRTVTATAVDCFSACQAKPLDQYAA